MESILTSIKILLGIQPEDTAFDLELVMHINTALAILQQLGVGPTTGFIITGSSETWEQYFKDSCSNEAVKSFVYLKVKLVFDPPTSSYVLTSIKEQIGELEFRLNS